MLRTVRSIATNVAAIIFTLAICLGTVAVLVFPALVFLAVLKYLFS